MAEIEWVRRLLAFMEREEADEEAFDDMAVELFRYQFRKNEPYRLFCRSRGRTHRTVRCWRDIPAVPIRAFKDSVLSCSDPERAEAVFMTSGTTDPGNRGRNIHPTLEVYDASMIRNFNNRFMGGRSRMRMGILFPSEEEAPHSSLAHYLGLALREFGTKESRYCTDREGVDFPRLYEDLEQAERSGEPYALLGASFYLVHLLDHMEETGRSFRLPEGSRILDTGGLKGRSRDIEPEEFYRELETRLGVPRERCINMYGMTELSTQFYDSGNRNLPAKKTGPHWVRSKVADPLSGEEVAAGETGLLVHCDLANFNSVAAVLTEDTGMAAGDGFTLLGRAEGAQAKGCSLAAEEFLRSVRG